MTDNWKLQYGRFARQSRNFWQVVVAIILLILCRARHHRQSRIWRGNLDALCHSSGDVIISGFGSHIDISGCRSLLYLPTLFYICTWSYILPCRWKFKCTVCSLRDISISGFGRHFLLSLIIIGIATPEYTSCESAMVECRRFAFGIFMIYVILSEISLFPVTWLPCRILDTRYRRP